MGDQRRPTPIIGPSYRGGNITSRSKYHINQALFPDSRDGLSR